ncbi:MAG: Ig-like domain-containing protein [Planctomycetota bacterium]|nr:Ig-like domain-containing protein [Planctomycetota bacterium]
MANRKSHSASFSSSSDSQKAKQDAKRRLRGLLLETLEERRLLAVGPQLVGIQPNGSDLLFNGDVRTESPRELTFRFDDMQQIHPDTLQGIRLTASGGDGSFGLPSAASDFGSRGAVEIQLTSTDEDRTLTVNVGSVDLGNGTAPSFGLSGDTITIVLNSNATSPTTAQQLVDAINTAPLLQSVMTAAINGGHADAALGTNALSIAVVDDNDVRIEPGFAVVGQAPNENEVTLRYGEALPDDQYRIEVFGFDDNVQGVVGLRNNDAGQPGELFIPSDPGTRKDTVDFYLDLGPQVTSVVPQPVIRGSNGLEQLRDTIVVHFDNDKLLVENDANGNPMPQSVENPEFYQLIFTKDTVRNTDDFRFFPQNVEYNAVTNSATLRFGQDINDLPGANAGPRTFRLRVGTRESAPMAPVVSNAAATTISDLNTDGAAKFRFVARELGEAGNGVEIVVVNSLSGNPLEITASGKTINVDLGSNNVTAGELLVALQNSSASSGLVSIQLEPGSDPNVVLDQPINYSPIQVVGLGSSFDTAGDLGVIGSTDVNQTSIILSSDIDPVAFESDLVGANDDPGHRQLPDTAGFERHINDLFGADSIDGVTTIPYNFQLLYGEDSIGTPLTNAITEKQKERAREALQIWSNQIGVQFIETDSQGITIATGSFNAFDGPGAGQVITEGGISTGVRIDPTFEDSLLVLSAVRQWEDNYGEDYFRAALTGMGMLLGLERAGDTPVGTLMRLSTGFVNGSGAEPIFPGTIDVLHAQHVFRNDSNDIDLYRFEVDLEPGREGLFVAETFAERLPNSSSLDTLLHVYKQRQAFANSNFAAGAGLNVRFDAIKPGRLGNNLEIFVTSSDRGAGAPVLVSAFENLITVDLNSHLGTESTAQQVVDAINADTAAAALVRASVTGGSPSTVLGSREITYSPIVLSDGDVELIARNDDYSSEDSKIELNLGSGTYYIGVSASGNDAYDGVIEDTGLDGSTQGRYDLRVTYRAQVDAADSIRDAAGTFPGDESIIFDGDADGTPGGTYDFWFQTRPLNRVLSFNAGATPSLEGKIVELTGANGVTRRFEFTTSTFVGVGNTAVVFTSGANSGTLAASLAQAILSRPELGINAVANGDEIELTGDRSVDLSPGLDVIDILGKTIFVDKTAGVNADGSLARPFNNISGAGVPNAFEAAQPGDIVRIVGNGGGDDDITTVGDNFAYEVGFSLIGNNPLSDGDALEVPQGVTTMIDAGAIFKLRRSHIGVGSSNLGVDRSGAALQVLGTPYLTDTDGGFLRDPLGNKVPGSVFFTSWLDEAIGQDTYLPDTQASTGDWGGISYRDDVDTDAGRRNLEDEGIFLQYVNHADLRYGGGSVNIDSVEQVVNPIQMIDVRPTVTFNTVSLSADAAMSAAPDSFAETSFHEPLYQLGGLFTSDYSRVGPDIHNNQLNNNSLNGLFIKVDTAAGQSIRPLTVGARFNDIDITHIVAENVIVTGTPGGAILDTTIPRANLVSLEPIPGGSLLPGSYNYKISFVDAAGYETPASEASFTAALTPGAEQAIRLRGLPRATGEYVSRRLYRSDSQGGGVYERVAEIDAISTEFLDTGLQAGGKLTRDRADVSGVTGLASAGQGTLNGVFNYRLVMVDAAGRESLASNPTGDVDTGAATNASITLTGLPTVQADFVSARVYRSATGGAGPYILVGSYGPSDTAFTDNGTNLGTELSIYTSGNLRPRLDASLVIDPGAVVKFEGARIELEQGTNMLAEGVDGADIILTSLLDDRFGASGSFDTNNDFDSASPAPRDWGGIYAGSGSNLSLDLTTFAYAGGVTRIEGTFKAFNPIEIQQAEARITNSHFEFNEDGIGGQGPTNRLGRLDNRPATIFVRAAQPIIFGNTFENNAGSVIDIDADSLNAKLKGDYGRSTGLIDRVEGLDTNRGPLVRDNRLANNELNGMEIRGRELRTASVWDDTDIVHVLFNSVSVSNLQHEGGLRLQSSPSESLVVKLLGYGSNFDLTAGTGITATGFHTNANDRVGGTVEIIGQPGFPVVLTSFHDDTVGAGLQPDGTPQTDTNNNGISSVPRSADWRSVLLDQFSNDQNVERILESESATAIAPGPNSLASTAQVLGNLAANDTSSDENNMRQGFSVLGALSEPTDVDVYSFTAEAGTEVWLDVDNTRHSLDLTIELLNADGDLLARSDDSNVETTNASLITKTAAIVPTFVNPLNEAVGDFRTNASGSFKEYGSTNPRDAGLRVLLPGATGARTTFHFRVRSASINPENFNAGLTSGSYEVQVRTGAAQDFPGSTIQYADIRYATNGVHLQGLPGHSPLLGEVQEDESSVGGGGYANNDVNALNNENAGDALIATPGARDQYIGNILAQDRATLSIGGQLASPFDLDFYRFDVQYVGQARNSLDSAQLVFDMDYADGLNRADTSLSVFRVTPGFNEPNYQLVLFAEDSNIADDIRSPLELTDIADMSRGSVGPKDPFIGSVGLPEGQYAVAVSPAGRIPAALNDAGTRRTPLYSVLDNDSFSVNGTGVSSTFNLGGYSALDLPRAYVTVGGFGGGDVFLRDANGQDTLIDTYAGGRQAILELGDFAGQDGLQLVFTNGGFTQGIDLTVGFAERGESISNAVPGTSFVGVPVPPSTLQSGEYQLEIRQARDTIVDTNDRAANQVTLIAPQGSDLDDGDTFLLTDAGNAITFEFTTDQFVTPGNVPVAFNGTESPAEIATAIRDAINDPGVQSRFNLKASGAGGEETAPSTDARVHLYGRAAGEFGKLGVQYHSGSSDKNTLRDQGQVLISNNFIRHSRDYGVWTEHGQRSSDPRDNIGSIWPLAGSSMSSRPATGNTAQGAIRNLGEPNNEVLGGFAPGIVVENNILESGGLGGVHVAGEHPIFMISAAFIPGWRDNPDTQGDHSTGTSTDPADHFGTLVEDGLAMTISGGRTTVDFEFEDMAADGGGGDGYADTNVPIWYRRDGGAAYLRGSAGTVGFSALETMQAIRDAIHGSILTTNGTTQTVKATVAPSFLPEALLNPGIGPSAGFINYFNNPAVFVEGVSSLSLGGPFNVQRVDAAETPQAFARVVNNTVYGNDGRASLDGSDRSAEEPNDFIREATQTWQGTGHNPQTYTATATLAGTDVDIYQFKLDIGERVRIDIDTPAGTSDLDSLLQIFDESGIRQTLLDGAGNEVNFIDNAAAPGEDLGLDPYLDFTATRPGVYYVAVSGSGNVEFDPLSMAGRIDATTSGQYDINLQVLHPQEFTVTVQDPSAYPAGSFFRVYQVADFADGTNFREFEFVDGGGGASNGRIPINIDYAEFRVSDVARAIAGAISAAGMGNAQALSNGDFNDASPLAGVTATALGGIDGVEAGLQLFGGRPDGLDGSHSSRGIGHDRTDSAEISGTSDGAGTQERFVVIENAAWVEGRGVIQVNPDLNASSNVDQLLPESGVLVSGGSSPTLMNNVFVNVQTPIFSEGGTKPGEVIVGGSAYQFSQGAPTNVPNTGLDFNFVLPNDHVVFENAQASVFLPAANSLIIDSSVDSLEERESFRTIKETVGIDISPVLAPTHDATGQLRVDDPSVSPPNGPGSDVFKDRGALDRADFIGPVAEALRPLDNDSRGDDQDTTVSVIQLESGVFPEFRIQLVDASAIRPARGINDPGQAVTLFENGRLLIEGFDYSFSFNSTTSELIFTPLAGVWKNGAVYEIAINNRDRFVIEAPSGDAYADGDSFTITDTSNGKVFFEFDSGYELQVPQGLSMQIPLAGGAQGGIVDGDRFSLVISGVTTTFEFDRNNNLLPGNIPITFAYGDTQEEIIQKIVTAIQGSGVAVAPKVVGGGTLFFGSELGAQLDTNFTTIDQPATTAALRVPTLGPRPGGVVDGQTFVVSDGTRSITFEYETMGGVTPGNTLVDISTALIAEDVANATLVAINNSGLNLNATLVSPLLIHLGLSDNGSVDAATSGLTAVGVARTLGDGQTFTVSTPTGSATYEFDNDGSVSAGNVAIPIAITDTEGEIGERIASAIVGSSLGLSPAHVGGGKVSIGGTVDDQVDVSNSQLGLFGEPGVRPGTRLNVFGPLLLSVPNSGGANIPDNATFVINANNQTVVFEFDSDFSGPSLPGNVTINFDGLTTQADLTLAIIAAINSSSLGITASNQGAGVLSVGALQASDVILNDSTLTTSRGVVSDGEVFSISNGVDRITFEFDNADLGNGFNLGNVPILFNSTSTSQSVVESMKAAIESTSLGLSPTVLDSSTLQLNDTPRFSTDVSAAPTLLQTGVPGGAKPVTFIRHPSFTGSDVKQAIVAAINGSTDTNLIAADRGSNTLFVENALNISPEIGSFFLQGVADLAGNLLQANRINNETQFTILMPGVALDYGDAPDPFTTTSGRYPTQHENDGARHVVGTDALLGATITAEPDGQPTPLGDGDLDDGVTFGANLLQPGVFNRNVFTSIDVTLSSPGFVDAWIDFNADGDWDDPGEQILRSERFDGSSLSQTFMVTVPSTSPVPNGPTTTFARFRSSTTGGLIPTGLSVGGEVEDYAVTIVPGDPPVAVNDTYTVNEDATLTTTDSTGTTTPNFTTDDGIAANDTDPNGDSLAVVVIDPPQHASLFLMDSDGTFTYTPEADFSGTDTFTYRVNDGTLASNNIGTVVINVAEVNDAPVAANDSLLINEDELLDISEADLLANDSAGPGNSEDSQTLTITSVSSVSAQGGTVQIDNGRVKYLPPSDFSGVDTFVYTVTDNGTTAGAAAPLSASATVTVTVLDKNDAPTPGNDFLTTLEDTPASVSTDDLISNDSPGPGNESTQVLQFKSAATTSLNGGTVSVDTNSGLVTYTPPADFVGTDTFTYVVEDNGLSGGLPDPAEATGTVTVTVTGENDAPRIAAPFGVIPMQEDAPARIINLNDIFVDPDVATSGDVLTFTIVDNDNASLVTPVITGSQLQLQLEADQNGQALVVVKAEDAAGLSIQDTLTLTVVPVNDAPRLVQALPDITTDEDVDPAVITLAPDFFFDPDVTLNGDLLTFSVIGNSNPALVTPVVAGNQLALQLTANQSGTAVISIRAEDTEGQAIIDTFNLTVNPVNDVPVTMPDSYVVPQGTELVTTDPRGSIPGTENDGVLANDVDPEGATLSALLVDAPAHASSFTLNANGTFTYQHDFTAGRQLDFFTYIASDGIGQSTTTTVTIEIAPPPPPPHQNPSDPFDVNADGFISPIDALLVINFLNTTGAVPVAGLPSPPPYRDVNGDNFITPIDALSVINELNQNSAGNGEGEFLDGSFAYPLHLFGSEYVFAASENRRIGMRDVQREDDMVYGPALPVTDVVFAEVAAADTVPADTSWVEDEADEEETHLALDQLMESEFGEDLS